MVKMFTPNKDGKIEFTKDELEKLLNEVWYDGKNHATYTWTSPWQTITTPYYTTATITGTNTTGVTVEYSSENHAGDSGQSSETDGASP